APESEVRAVRLARPDPARGHPLRGPLVPVPGVAPPTAAATIPPCGSLDRPSDSGPAHSDLLLLARVLSRSAHAGWVFHVAVWRRARCVDGCGRPGQSGARSGTRCCLAALGAPELVGWGARLSVSSSINTSVFVVDQRH